jgi:exosortase
MVHQWWTDEDMRYGCIVPLVIAWIVWRDRGRCRSLPVQPSIWGFAVLAVAAGLQVASALGAGLFAGSLAFVLSLVGSVLCLLGFAWLRAWAFPLLLTLFMLPKLAIVYNQITLPLQLLVTRLAGGMLSTVGFAVVRDGNILNVAGHSISVVEDCDGIRYLLPLASRAGVRLRGQREILDASGDAGCGDPDGYCRERASSCVLRALAHADRRDSARNIGHVYFSFVPGI